MQKKKKYETSLPPSQTSKCSFFDPNSSNNSRSPVYSSSLQKHTVRNRVGHNLRNCDPRKKKKIYSSKISNQKKKITQYP